MDIYTGVLQGILEKKWSLEISNGIRSSEQADNCMK
jgi:hypothetical protein